MLGDCYIDDYELRLQGHDRVVEVHGRCLRNIDSTIECSVAKVMHEGVNILGALTTREIEPMRARLTCQYISDRRPYGDGQDSAS